MWKLSHQVANFCWALAGSAVYSVCQWAVLVAMVKTLPTEQVGAFAFATAINAPLFLLCNVRLRNLLASGVTTPGGFGDYVVARAGAMGIAWIASLVLAGAVGLTSTTGRAVMLLGLAKAIDGLSDICHGEFQRGKQLRLAAAGLMINGLASLGLVCAALVAGASISLTIVAYACGSAIALIGWDWPQVRNAVLWTGCAGSAGRIDDRARAAASLIRRSAPLGVSTALSSLQANLPKYFVGVYLGASSLAVYSGLAYLPTLGAFVIGALGQSALPELAGEYHTSRRAYWRRVRGLMACGFALGVTLLALTAVFGKWLLSVAYTAEYTSHSALLAVLMAAAAVSFTFVFLGTALTARLHLRSQMVVSLAGTVVLLMTTGPLLSRYGLIGAGYAVLLATVTEATAYVAVSIGDFRTPQTSESCLTATASSS